MVHACCCEVPFGSVVGEELFIVLWFPFGGDAAESSVVDMRVPGLIEVAWLSYDNRGGCKSGGVVDWSG